MNVPNRVANRLIAVATVITLTIMLGAGCHDPNDPNINPKARHALARQAMIDALRPFNSYRQETIRQVNPQRKQPETLPEKFIVAYDPVNRRMHLRTSIDSFENLETLPHPRSSNGVGTDGENR